MALITVKNLSVRLGNKQVLKHINLQIPAGTVTVIVGPSGSGKTTLLRTLNLLQIPTEGSIQIDGVTAVAGKINRQTIRRIRTKSAMVFQQFNLFKNLTAIENVIAPLILNKMAGFAEARQRGKELLKEVGLEDIADQYPVTLSGGQQQRVSIARAIAVKPKVILFDEPTSALDPELVKSVLNTIAKLASQNITMAIVTHEIAFARQIADQAVFVEDGVIVGQGPAKQILSSKGNGRIAQFVNSLAHVGTSLAYE
ncbi:MAG: amino acid ABC transporter ATP-binding protein [Sporolactobacillus sp.]|jgi:putative amino-acid transport system ATP-binding protein|nr:amino acid ABC transporter ATP-binding protein [Sporolactobacillus sp.]